MTTLGYTSLRVGRVPSFGSPDKLERWGSHVRWQNIPDTPGGHLASSLRTDCYSAWGKITVKRSDNHCARESQNPPGREHGRHPGARLPRAGRMAKAAFVAGVLVTGRCQGGDTRGAMGEGRQHAVPQSAWERGLWEKRVSGKREAAERELRTDGASGAPDGEKNGWKSLLSGLSRIIISLPAGLQSGRASHDHSTSAVP